ncbi:response regulator transcription factor [Halomonas sp. TD01]|uniref:response regulator transcription factor n=2 Tax=Oceanospirillales TaxID=135619 RepID=UPI000214DF51|nr:response regulator transcription factor [Halomonas sp. TD01]EGP19716.1 LuxR family transcriptional regulator [Halomonas sp. TD01]CAH1042684.1 Transcriptional regulator VpsT [Halomonas sp. TD01]
MSQEKTIGLVYLITEQSPQSQLFADYLLDHTHCSISIYSPDSTIPSSPVEQLLILIDSDHISVEALPDWQEKLPETLAKTPLAAFNIRDMDHALEALACTQLKGIFYRNESLEVFCKGIHALLNDELWMSRDLMAKLVLFYRKYQSNAFRPTCGLTSREMEIISLLSIGSSNHQIADKLCVSEHTVKSHLYNIFRKINVHNRIQALNWIHQNLGPILPNIETARSLQRHR